MIKRIFLMTLFVMGTFLTSFADEQKKITLNNNDHTTETIGLADCCNIFVSLKDVDDNDNAEITVELENIHESNTLILFERAYDEKTLKKMRPSISYHKSYPRSMNKCDIDACQDINSTIRLTPSQKDTLFSKSFAVHSPMLCRLPIHIAKKNKSGSKISLWMKEVIELEIHVQLKPDEEYIRIADSYEALIREIDSVTFCTNKKHKGESLESLKSKYEEKINDLKSQIRKINTARNYMSTEKPYMKFKEFLTKLDTISIDAKVVNSCSKDRKIPGTVHNCKNCNLTYEQIYKKLDKISVEIHNGKKTKAQVKSDVESLYTCVLKNTKRPANNTKKSQITKCYNNIMSVK